MIWKIVTVIFAASLVEAKWSHHQKRETVSSICDPIYNNTNKIQCYCVKDGREPETVRSAECYVTSDGVGSNDLNWEAFTTLKNISKLTFTNTRGITLKYIPTNALKHTEKLEKFDVKYANIEKVPAFAISNLSFIDEITLRDNQIEKLETNAFAHLKELTTISLDKNNIVEINRDVFIELPSLEKLYLTNNKITTIHDRAFVHLNNLKELEIDRNRLFSLNSETFSGLKQLQKLDLSGNNLEVIGDNTFLPLINLQSLNLEGNKIQMLDEKAFNGLSKLQSLSLAHNKLSDIENVKTFKGLDSLISLSLRENQIRELKTEVMAPILHNFYGVNSNLDVEDNNFPCDCRLDWFLSLMNETQNNHLKLAIENIKCHPDAELKEKWTKTVETVKNEGQVFEDEETRAQNTDYEYYDESQLNGKLFYIDVRDLLNCSIPTQEYLPQTKSLTEATTDKSTTAKIAEILNTKAISSPTVDVTRNTVTPSTVRLVTEYKPTKVTNEGLANISIEETTKLTASTALTKDNIYNTAENEITNEKKQHSPTTSRLATVSAKPIEHKNDYDDHMAADEAKPDKLKAHRSIQEQINDTPKFKVNSSHRNIGCVTILTLLMCLRLFY